MAAKPNASRQPRLVRVAVPSPLRRSFDYLPPAGRRELPSPGARVRVPFGPATRIGVVLEHGADSDVPEGRLKRIHQVLDDDPLLPPETLGLLRWAADYFHHPIGEVVLGALPAPLRRGRPLPANTERRWRLSHRGRSIERAELARAPRRAALWQALYDAPEGLAREQLQSMAGDWRGALAALLDRGWVEVVEVSAERPREAASTAAQHAPSAEQQAIIERIFAARNGFASFLLDGVTGSGKTEVYLGLVERLAALGRQTLLLIPEIGLTPQIVARLRERISAPMAVLHSGLSDQERLRAWAMARDGRAVVIVGTRSAVFAPLARAGMLIVDEEHDASFKQQDGFRYSARDLAIVRARRLAVPVLLGSATPSLESLNNVARGRHQGLVLSARARGSEAPTVEVVDLRGRSFDEGLSLELCEAIDSTLRQGQQSLLFVNRRGYAPVLMCHACGWQADCARCDAHMVYHHSGERLRCHHCGAERPVPGSCPDCAGGDLRALGLGTQRVADALARRFPDARIDRVDRDSTRRKGALEEVLEAIHDGRTQILVGTQMLAKGHHFPNVTLVGILDADGGLFGADFRAAERMAQLLVQVAGRAGRGRHSGRVLIQTHHPHHPLLEVLVKQGFRHFGLLALEERREARLPPFSSLALLRAEAPRREATLAFLGEARDIAATCEAPRVQALGPVPAPMERRAGRYRAQLLLQCDERGPLHALLASLLPALEQLKSGRRVRWSLDVDPQEML